MRLHVTGFPIAVVAGLAFACGGDDGVNAPGPDTGVDAAVLPPYDGSDDGGAVADATTDVARDAPSDADTNADTNADAGPPTGCIVCHGSAKNAAPPLALNSASVTSDPGVGAHQSHLGPSSWHHEMLCTECHLVPPTANYDPLFPKHRNGILELTWGPIAKSGSYASLTCTGTYCHGATLKADRKNSTSNRTPKWTTVDGSQKVCGTSCHTLPPGGGHTQSTACETCHSMVVSSFAPGNPPTVVWKDASLHIDGKVDVNWGALSCTSCHGDTNTKNPAPPLGTNGETSTSQAAVGAHTEHLASSAWHRVGQCTDCHTVPGSMNHSNGVTDLTWGAVSKAHGAQPAYASTTCTGVYCHGTTLMGPIQNGTVSRSPVWNVVNGSYDSCGDTCHTNPPGGTHPVATMTNCPTCHGAVVATYNPNTKAATWTNAALHVNGNVEVIPMTCTTCHGTGPSQINPPTGVGGESTTGTLAVGRHVAHLTASNTHVAFACNTCHVVPPQNDLSHTSGYVPSPNLVTAGHHGDVTFANQAVGMTFNVAATQGNVTARGTCLGACHSNGHGGPPLVTPYWAGGAWNTGSCGSCHAGTMNTLPERHPTHDGEATCADCHPPANSGTHVNGTLNVNPTITGSGNDGGVTTLPPGAQGNPCPPGVWACTGTCHGKNHSPRCWQ